LIAVQIWIEGNDKDIFGDIISFNGYGCGIY